MSMEKHVQVVGALHIGLSILGILAAVVVLMSLLLPAWIVSTEGDTEAVPILIAIGCGVSGFLGVLSIPGIVGGWGVLKHRRWARILILIVAVLNLLNIPIGTAVGVYTLWVLMQDEAEALFAA